MYDFQIFEDIYIGEDIIYDPCSMTGRKDKCIQYFVRKPEGRRPLGRCRCIEVDNIKIDFK